MRCGLASRATVASGESGGGGLGLESARWVVVDLWGLVPQIYVPYVMGIASKSVTNVVTGFLVKPVTNALGNYRHTFERVTGGTGNPWAL